MIEFYNDCTINRSNGEKLTITYNHDYYYTFLGNPWSDHIDIEKSDFCLPFYNDSDLKIFIANHCEAAIFQKVIKAGDTYYLDLVTRPCVCNPLQDIKLARFVLKPQLAIFKPIIEYFMLHGFDKLFNAGCPKSLLNIEKTEPTFLNKITKGTWYVSFNKKEKSRNPFKGWNWIFVNGKQTDHILIPSEVVDTFHKINANNQQQGTIYITKEGIPHRYATKGSNYTYKDGLFIGEFFVVSEYT